MPVFIIITLVLALAALYTFYLYQEAKSKNASQNVRKTLNARIEKFKRSFKTDTQELASSGVLSKQGLDAIYRLPNYYFVFQPITVENVERYEQLLGSLLTVIHDKLLPGLEASEVPTSVQEQLDQFVRSLPTVAKGYDASFYRNDLPVLMQRLMDTQVEFVEAKVSQESMTMA